jgi:hypothetical protein
MPYHIIKQIFIYFYIFNHILKIEYLLKKQNSENSRKQTKGFYQTNI